MQRGILVLSIAVALASAADAQEPMFQVTEIPSPGRTATAGFADLDGDGRADLYAVSLSGVPPRARRVLRVHFQASDGTFRPEPDWTGPIAGDAAAYDVAELDDTPGLEFFELRRHSLRVTSLRGRSAQQRELVIPGDPTAAVGADERGIDRLRMARSTGDRVRLIIPGLGECIVLERDGTLVARLDAGERTNYFLPPRPGPLLSESEFESYFDFPRVEIGDTNGDGRPDLLFASRHELRVFHQDAAGGFAPIADVQLALGRLDEQDLIRGSGNVRVAADDVDGDGRLDLLITTTKGGLMNARSETTLHLQREGRWNLDEAHREWVLESGWSALQLVDVDGDGRTELLEARMAFSLLELVETLLTQEVDAEVSIYPSDPTHGFALEPEVEIDVHIQLDLETTSFKGFAPTVSADMNGDGGRDRVTSAGGDAIEVYLGGGDRPFERRAGKQALDSRGTIRFGDMNDDGLDDAVLYRREEIGAPMRVLVNRGVLPGTPKREVIKSAE